MNILLNHTLVKNIIRIDRSVNFFVKYGKSKALTFPDQYSVFFRGRGKLSYYEVKNRHLYHCARCGHQASVTANTIFHRSHTPLTKWFVAIFMMADDKRGISAAKLARNINVSPPTAWLMLHKTGNGSSHGWIQGV
jgi:hypothetical protein